MNGLLYYRKHICWSSPGANYEIDNNIYVYIREEKEYVNQLARRLSHFLAKKKF